MLILGVLEIALQQAWYSNTTTGSNAEHRMSPSPPKYANKNANKTPSQLLSSQLLDVNYVE